MKNNKSRFWVVGKISPGSNYGWEFCGLFSTETKAKKVCLNEYYFIGPVTLDKVLPEAPEEWVGAYYPDPSV